MYYMMEHLSRTSEIFDDDVRAEYRDYYQDFTLKYGITPTEYIVFLFWELHYYNSSKNALSKSKCWRNVDIIYKDIIDILKTEPFKLKECAKQTEMEEWDFTSFFAFPFLSDGGKRIHIYK